MVSEAFSRDFTDTIETVEATNDVTDSECTSTTLMARCRECDWMEERCIAGERSGDAF